MNKTFCKTSFLYTTFLALSLLFIAGCGDDGNPSAPDNENELSSSSSGLSAKSSTAMSKSSSSSKDSKKDKQDNTQEDYIVLEVEHDSITDPRDGKIYKTVKIGKQTWMAENLNYADSKKTPSLKGKNWCYDDIAENCNANGRLYTWSAAIDSIKLATNTKEPLDCGYDRICELYGTIQGICPEGWHLPKTEEWRSLFTTVGDQSIAGKILKTQTGWGNDANGDDPYKFSIRPTGIRDDDGDYFAEGEYAEFWTSTEEYGYGANIISFNDGGGRVNVGNHQANYGLSVRCLKDNLIDDKPNNVIPEGAIDPSTVITGSATDSRDGHTYKTVTIGNQTWLAENLNYETENSYCYENSIEYYCPKYGRLYTWADAVGKSENECGVDHECDFGDKNVRGICPEYWHLPSMDEWNQLITAVGGEDIAGKMLKYTRSWSGDEVGVDAYSFAVFPAGHKNYDGSPAGSGFGSAGFRTNFWSSTEFSRSNVYAIAFVSDYVYWTDDNNKGDGYSVRCIKDEE